MSERRVGERVHFASALTLLERQDGADADSGASYLELADLLIRLGADTGRDLRQLWRRMPPSGPGARWPPPEVSPARLKTG